MLRKPLLSLLLLLIGYLPIEASISISYPTDRAIFQRSNNNEATLTVAGYFDEAFKRIEARAVPLVNGEGQPSPADGSWTTIQNSPPGGQFYGSLLVKGGWYRLEIRGVIDESTFKTTTLDHVGVGEVFVVAGQSNATGGDSNPNGPGAKYDQVNSINYQNYDPGAGYIAPYNDMQLPCPRFVHLDAGTKTAPFGNYAWCWGAFGDQLYERLRVPILIFNAGWSSTDIENWRKTIDPLGIAQSAFGYTFPQGQPFGHLRAALNNYINQQGVRAVLWHQGESDNYLEQPNDNTYSHYLSALWEVIGATRSLSIKPDLAWVVARASRFTVNGVSRTSANVINAQNELINNDAMYAHVYQGPDTDPYYSVEYRSDQIHFRGDGVTPDQDGHVYSGLLSLAGFWSEKITDGFLSSSVPYPATPPVHVNASSEPGTARIVFTAPSIPSGGQYHWFVPNNCNTYFSSGNQSYTASAGTYQLKSVDAMNNVVFSPVLGVSNVALPVVWQYFSVIRNTENSVLIRWSTSEEHNSATFEIQRSANAQDFKTIATIDAAGYSKTVKNYVYTDNDLTAGTYYYRIRQQDLDGTLELTRIASVTVEYKNPVVLYPNPVTDKLFIDSKIVFNQAIVTDISGRTVLSIIAASELKQLDLSSLPGGLYTVQLGGKSYKILK